MNNVKQHHFINGAIILTASALITQDALNNISATKALSSDFLSVLSCQILAIAIAVAAPLLGYLKTNLKDPFSIIAKYGAILGTGVLTCVAMSFDNETNNQLSSVVSSEIAYQQEARNKLSKDLTRCALDPFCIQEDQKDLSEKMTDNVMDMMDGYQVSTEDVKFGQELFWLLMLFRAFIVPLITTKLIEQLRFDPSNKSMAIPSVTKMTRTQKRRRLNESEIIALQVVYDDLVQRGIKNPTQDEVITAAREGKNMKLHKSQLKEPWPDIKTTVSRWQEYREKAS